MFGGIVFNTAIAGKINLPSLFRSDNMMSFLYASRDYKFCGCGGAGRFVAYDSSSPIGI